MTISPAAAPIAAAFVSLLIGLAEPGTGPSMGEGGR